MSNDPAANMASLLALCDDLCETESAAVDRRQLCEWLSAMQAQAHEIQRLRRDSDRHNAEWHDKVNENAANYHHRLAAEADAARLRSVIVVVMGMIDEASNSPQSVDRWLDRIEEACEAALGGQP